MTEFGKFLELSLPTPDIQASLGFYRDLGFTELATGDIRQYFYAVVSDGRTAIGLHGGGLETPALGFVHPNVVAAARTLESEGVELVHRRLGYEEFHEVGIADPDGNMALLMAAPTFSTSAVFDCPAPATGRTIAIALPSRIPQRAAEFWLSRGFSADEPGDPGGVRLLSPGLVMELTRNLRQPALRLRTDDVDLLSATLDRAGIAADSVGAEMMITAPEGTELLISLP